MGNYPIFVNMITRSPLPNYNLHVIIHTSTFESYQPTVLQCNWRNFELAKMAAKVPCVDKDTFLQKLVRIKMVVPPWQLLPFIHDDCDYSIVLCHLVCVPNLTLKANCFKWVLHPNHSENYSLALKNYNLV